MATVYQVSPVHAYLLVALQRVRTLMSSIMPSMQNGRTVPGSGQRYWLGRAEETSDPVAFGSIQQRNRFIVAENPVGPGTESSDHGYYLMSNSSSSMDVPGNTTEDFDTWDAWIEWSATSPESWSNEQATSPSSVQRVANPASDSVSGNQEPDTHHYLFDMAAASTHVDSWPMEMTLGYMDCHWMELNTGVTNQYSIDYAQRSQRNSLHSSSVAGSNTISSQEMELQRFSGPHVQTAPPSWESPRPELQNSYSRLPPRNSDLQSRDEISRGMTTQIDLDAAHLPIARKSAESRRNLGATDAQRTDLAHQQQPFRCDELVCEEQNCNQRPCNQHRCGQTFTRKWFLKRHKKEHQNRRGEISDKLSCPVLHCPKQNAWMRDRIGNLRDHLVRGHKLTDECPRCHLKFGKNLLEHLMLPDTKCGVKLKWKDKSSVEGYDKVLPRASPPPSAFTNPVMPLE